MQRKQPRIMFNVSFLLFNHVSKKTNWNSQLKTWQVGNCWSRFNTPSSWCCFCFFCWMNAHCAVCASLSFLARSWNKKKLNHQPVQPAIWGKRLYSCWHIHMTIMLFSRFYHKTSDGRKKMKMEILFLYNHHQTIFETIVK